jgi:rRNA maturation endonuclease Nob1
MIIPVEVQRPCEPKSARFVGEESDDLTAEEVAERVGVPVGCFIAGKIMKGKKGRRWSLVADVKFGKSNEKKVCPHCGHKL